jgi:hypothetical protein
VKKNADSRCGTCTHFIDDPADFERALPGILILSSGQGDSRGNQGLCRVHERLLTPNTSCERFVPRLTPGAFEPLPPSHT